MACLLSAGFTCPLRAADPAGAAEQGPLAPLARLAGSCWTGSFADGKTKDLICYEWVFEGKFLRSRHHVVGAGAPYAGEALYSFDKAANALHYDYFNSLGDVLRGEVVPGADGVTFPIERVTIGGESAEIRSSWKWRGEDGYLAITDRRFGDEWRTVFTIEFTRDAAPAAAGAELLAPLRHLAGGVWQGSGVWPGGSPLRVETRYSWGVTGRLLRFETLDLSEGERRPLYEGFLFFDPARQAVVQWNFKTDGTRDESVLGHLDATGFEVEGKATRSRVHFVAPDEMRWELSVPVAPGEWKQVLEATYRRQAESVTLVPAPRR
jgi:hypothetical protein